MPLELLKSTKHPLTGPLSPVRFVKLVTRTDLTDKGLKLKSDKNSKVIWGLQLYCHRCIYTIKKWQQQFIRLSDRLASDVWAMFEGVPSARAVMLRVH